MHSGSVLQRSMSALILAATLASTAHAQDRNHPFDGTWLVILRCDAARDGAAGYTFNFLAAVKDGVLHGEYGVRGQASSLSLDGTIQPDGTALLFAHGLTGDPPTTSGASPRPCPTPITCNPASRAPTAPAHGWNCGRATQCSPGNRVPRQHASASTQSTPRVAPYPRRGRPIRPHRSRRLDRNLRGPGRARDVPQRGDRVLRAPREGARAARPGHGRRPRRLDQRGRVGERVRRLGPGPAARLAVQGRHPRHHAAHHGGGHRALPRLRPDPRRRPGLCQEAGRRLRHRRARPDRAGAGPPARGRGHRPQARRRHRRGLGRAESRARDHAVPARARGRHRAGGPHLPHLRPGRDTGRHREPLPARPRHPRHRLPHRRPHRRQPRRRQGRPRPRARGHLLRPGRGHGRRPLRPARGRAGASRGRAARGGPSPGRAGARGRAPRRRGDRRHGRGPALRLPRPALPGRARDRRQAARPRPRPAALGRRGRGARDPLGGGADGPRPRPEPA